MAETRDPVITVIRGIALSVLATGLGVAITRGVFYLPDNTRVQYSGTVNASVASATPKTWLHVYGYNDETQTPQAILSAVPPDAPYQDTARTMTGDASKRYLGSVRVGDDGKILPFRHAVAAAQGNKIRYTIPGGISSAYAGLVLAGLKQVATAVDASSMVPPTSMTLLAQLENSSGVPVYIGNTDIGTISASNALISVFAGNSIQAEVMLDSTQKFYYIFGAGLNIAGGLNARATGYIFDR